VITGATRLVGLIGHPVSGSLSPRMQNAAFAARALDWAYVPLDVEPGDLEAAVRGLPALGFAGANVTAPHKLAVADLVETDAPSVNTLVVDGSRMVGSSTDTAVLAGLEWSRPVIFGDGGAARAFAAALPGARVFARRGEWPPDVSGADLIVNATPVVNDPLIEPRPEQTVIDLPYRADGGETALSTAARASGCTVLDGLEALVAQGAASFELWTGVPAPVEVLRAALGLGP
jgi:shikimate dehydrogenase